MPPRNSKATPGTTPDAASVVARLRALATQATLDGMSRYGLPSEKALGVSIADIQKLAKQLGHDHALAEGLWKTDIYEARLLCAFVDDPALVTAAQMDRWCRDFDNWGIVDTLCFKLFDQAPDRWKMIPKWCARKPEFERRAGFAMIACLAAHDKKATDAQFLECLPLIEKHATDERNFVKKGVSWALRMVGRRNAALGRSAMELAEELAGSDNATERWIGKDVVRDLVKAGGRKSGRS